MISFEKRKDYVFWHSLIARHNTHNILQPSGNTSSKYSLSTCQASSASSMGSVWICLDVTLQFTGICLQSVFYGFHKHVKSCHMLPQLHHSKIFKRLWIYRNCMEPVTGPADHFDAKLKEETPCPLQRKHATKHTTDIGSTTIKTHTCQSMERFQHFNSVLDECEVLLQWIRMAQVIASKFSFPRNHMLQTPHAQTTFWSFHGDSMSKKCTPLWREGHLEVKCVKNLGF